MKPGISKPLSFSFSFSSNKKSILESEPLAFFDKTSFFKDSVFKDLVLKDWNVLTLNEAKKQNKKKNEKYVALFNFIV